MPKRKRFVRGKHKGKSKMPPKVVAYFKLKNEHPGWSKAKLKKEAGL